MGCVQIRHADPERDAAACAAIYAPYVEQTSVSFEEVAPTAERFAELIAVTSERYPWLVAEVDARVVGYTYAVEHRARAAYRWAADVAIYVDPGHHRRGTASALYEALFELLRRQGLTSVVAGVTLPNDPSVGLHRALGFELVGTYRDIGWKAGAWRDVTWWQRQLGGAPREGGPPPEPRGPQRL
jgi:phosphinothricin acetyltransferase